MCFISGKWVEGIKTFPVLDKTDQTTIAQVWEPSADQVAQAVDAARDAFTADKATPIDRAKWLRRAAELINLRRDEFQVVMMAEGGFTAADITAEIDRSLVTLSLAAEEATRIVGETVALAATPGQHERLAFTIRVPLGVICAITPFNAPLNVVLHKVAPALAAGNAVVLKPSAFTPLTAALLCEVLLDAGVSPGLITLLHGNSPAIGRALLAHRGIDFYTFTGSTAVGRLIQKGAGLRRTQLELGSIASTIICADADIDRAMPKVANASFRKAGQVCTSIQRLYVAAPIVERVTERLVAVAAEMPAGDPRLPTSRIGPMISEVAAARAESWVEEACASQARVLHGGTRHGPVMQPTVLTGIRRGMKVYDDEIFAPVVSIIPFDNLSEAIDGANDTPYGLATGIFTADLTSALRAAKTLRFGGIHINETSSSRVDGMPYGGVKESGFGHEGPKYAIRDYTEERIVTFTS